MVSKKWLSRWAAVALAVIVLGPGATSVSSHPIRSAAHDSGLVMLSTQFTPVQEAEKFRAILSSSPTSVNFLPGDAGAYTDRIKAEETAGHVTVSLYAGLHGDMVPLSAAGYLQDVSPLLKTLQKRGFPKSFLKLAMMGSKTRHYYVPWMQATYVMAVNRKALKYLPKGAKIDALTYDDLIQWGKNMKKGTGQRMIGIPAGPTGLIHRFIQGYLYPSFAHSSGVSGFKSADAVKMWQKVKDLWAVSNPQSASYGFMQEPLLSGEVWVAWDHVARLINAATQKPKDFVLVPAPAGPKGRGFMLVIAGLAIPKGAPSAKAAQQVIDFLTKPQQQTSVLEKLAFFPATNVKIPSNLPAGIRLEALAVQKQAQSRHIVPALLPIGLGDKGGVFNKIYIDTFHRIILNNEGIKAVLKDEGQQLQSIMDATKAKCWAPDPPSAGTCHVK